jgi:hypothetical protein
VLETLEVRVLVASSRPSRCRRLSVFLLPRCYRAARARRRTPRAARPARPLGVDGDERRERGGEAALARVSELLFVEVVRTCPRSRRRRWGASPGCGTTTSAGRSRRCTIARRTRGTWTVSALGRGRPGGLEAR